MNKIIKLKKLIMKNNIDKSKNWSKKKYSKYDEK